MFFTKMNGTGNDFIIIDNLNHENDDIYRYSIELCNRQKGIGADGIIFVEESANCDYKMRIINADGSEASMCGNGIRCFAQYIWLNNLNDKDFLTIETGDGIKKAYKQENEGEIWVKIDMGSPNFSPDAIPSRSIKEIINEAIEANEKSYKITSLHMGVPHTVIFGELSSYDVKEGSYIEKYRLFPQGTNVNFCEINSPTEVKVKTWERGVGPTLACGTGSCACVVAGHKLGLLSSRVRVNVPGGVLDIILEGDKVYMIGPAKVNFTGEYNSL